MMPDLPRALNDIIMISLEKDPGKRFQTAEAFSAALGSITSGLNSTPMQAATGPVAHTAQWPQSTPQQASATGMVGTPTAPASPRYTQPMAVGGTVPGGYIPTGQQPTAPEPEAPAAATLPPPVPSHGVPAVGGSKGYRGLYMTLGALIALAVIVVAATQIPRFLKTHASGDQTAQVSTAATPNPGSPNTSTADTSTPPAGAPNSTTAASSPNPSTSLAAGGLDTSNASSRAGGGATTSPASGSPASQNSGSRGGQSTRMTNKSPQNQISSSNLAAGGEQSGAPTAPAGGGQAAQSTPGNNSEKAQELEELGDLHTKLAVRAQAANDSVENLRKQMAATGNNLRSDISASQTRMKMYMDKFDAAMNAGDPASAKKYMALAEREVENLEKFFGQ
jgi:serine/threonine-protein kinase